MPELPSFEPSRFYWRQGWWFCWFSVRFGFCWGYLWQFGRLRDCWQRTLWRKHPHSGFLATPAKNKYRIVEECTRYWYLFQKAMIAQIQQAENTIIGCNYLVPNLVFCVNCVTKLFKLILVRQRRRGNGKKRVDGFFWFFSRTEVVAALHLI